MDRLALPSTNRFAVSVDPFLKILPIAFGDFQVALVHEELLLRFGQST